MNDIQKQPTRELLLDVLRDVSIFFDDCLIKDKRLSDTFSHLPQDVIEEMWELYYSISDVMGQQPPAPQKRASKP